MTDKAVAVAAAIRDSQIGDALRVAGKRRQYVRACMAEAHASLHNMATELIREIDVEEAEVQRAAIQAYHYVLGDLDMVDLL